MSLKIAIIAGEPSGDMQAASLIAALHAISTEPIHFMGIGGEQMAKTGFVSLYSMDILSVGGYGFDVLVSIPKIYMLFRKITKDIIKFEPDVFIGVDAPDFNFHVEKKLKQYGIKTIHYISPTIWAWRYERIFKIKQTTDFMLCIFPMEEAMYRKENIPAKFIGNPLADKIECDIDSLVYKKVLCANMPFSVSSKMFTVLVGSRKAEIKRLASSFIDACSIIAEQIGEPIVFLFPFAKQSTHDAFLQVMQQKMVKFQYQVLLNCTSDAIKAADLVLSKSGTVTLEVALCKKPMVISYKVSKLTEWIIRRKIKIKYVGQPNILLDEEVAKELLQDDATPEAIAQEMLKLYKDNTRQQYVIKRFYDLHKMLRRDAANCGARAVLEFIQQ